VALHAPTLLAPANGSCVKALITALVAFTPSFGNENRAQKRIALHIARFNKRRDLKQELQCNFLDFSRNIWMLITILVKPKKMGFDMISASPKLRTYVYRNGLMSSCYMPF